ncbi:heme oxygenase [Cupriavidus sp. SW-Y-13]|nr:heme oxygenase [Cupriavidus sp. SW-Y-13]
MITYVTEHSTPPSDVLASLRAATSEKHAVLDRAMPLAHAAPTLVDYRDHLLILRAWLAPLETWLAGFDDGPQDPARLPQVSRADVLEQDLADTAIPQGGATVDNIDVGTLRSEPAYRWGLCYVIEGSQLGGAVIYRNFAERLAPHPLRYLGGGASPGPRWQQFLHALRTHVTTDDDIALAGQGAQRAFDDLLARIPSMASGHGVK